VRQRCRALLNADVRPHVRASHALYVLFALVVPPALALEPDGPSELPIQTARIVYGAKDPTCRSALAIVASVSNFDFVFGNWQSAFGQNVFETDKTPKPSALPDSPSIHFARVDIDNDGNADDVVITTNMLRSVDVDSLFVLHPPLLEQAVNRDAFYATLAKAPSINPGGAVMFSNGQDATPTEIHVWNVGALNLLVMKELGFAQNDRQEPEHPAPHSLVVGQIEARATIPAPKWDTNPRLVVKMLCRLES